MVKHNFNSIFNSGKIMFSWPNEVYIFISYFLKIYDYLCHFSFIKIDTSGIAQILPLLKQQQQERIYFNEIQQVRYE